LASGEHYASAQGCGLAKNAKIAKESQSQKR
jgi:hypothetical protein